MANPIKFAQLARTLQAKVPYSIISSKGGNSSLSLAFDGPRRRVIVTFREEDGGDTLGVGASSDMNDALSVAFPWSISAEMYVVTLVSEFISYLNME